MCKRGDVMRSFKFKDNIKNKVDNRKKKLEY